MDITQFKQRYIKQEFDISEEYGDIVSFIDFGNVNFWFEDDRQTDDHVELQDTEKFFIDIQKLNDFLSIFSRNNRFYYGHDPENKGSLKFIQKAQDIFGKHHVHTKAIQKTRHYLQTTVEVNANTRNLFQDVDGRYVLIPKCNFDVEISVDAIKMIEHYATICLLSGDADFVHLLRFLKQKGKKVILIKGGHITHQLKSVADSILNAQDIKKYIVGIKQKPS